MQTGYKRQQVKGRRPRRRVTPHPFVNAEVVPVDRWLTSFTMDVKVLQAPPGSRATLSDLRRECGQPWVQIGYLNLSSNRQQTPALVAARVRRI
jgi:hypothetical protein